MRLFLHERILYVDDEICLSYHSGRLICRKNGIMQQVPIGTVYNKFGMAERLMRKEPRCAGKINGNDFAVSFDGKVLLYSVSDNTVYTEHVFNKQMNNPLSFLGVYDPNEKENALYYGEYISNINKGPVAVYKRFRGNWNKVYEFPGNTIEHIHGIVNDPYRNCFIILTGDRDSESGIWLADYDFKKVEPLLIGKQQYRACVAFPIESGIIYATDTPLEQNYIYRVTLKGREAIGIEREYKMPGPCIFGASVNDQMFFSTSVEPDSSLPSWRYRFTYQLGKGVIDRSSHLIQRSGNGEYNDIIQLKKDIMPIWLFQFGNMLFPENETARLYVVLQGLKEGHGITFEITNINCGEGNKNE